MELPGGWKREKGIRVCKKYGGDEDEELGRNTAGGGGR